MDKDHLIELISNSILYESKNPKKRFNFRFVKRELWPQSCINENVLDEKRVRKKVKGINKNPFNNNEKGWFIIW